MAREILHLQRPARSSSGGRTGCIPARRDSGRWAILHAVAFLLLAASALGAQEFDWRLRPRFSPPQVPADNAMSADKAALGRYLFYDRRLSVNGQQSCASCHRQELAFTDGLAQAKGTTGEVHPRSSMSLVNIAYAPTLTWADPNLTDLAPQALGPMFGTEPVEMGLKGEEQALLTRLRKEPVYQDLFPRAFPEQPSPITVENVTKALAAFERTIISTRSPYDRYRYDGVEDAISAAAKRGEKLFFSGEKAGCSQCHGGWTFAGPVRFAGGPATEAEFHNTGLREIYKAPNNGIERHTGKPSDNGKFKAPTLRNIALTAPYMHDGSIPTLESVLDHYASGGKASANKSPAMRAHKLSPQERADLIEFLKTLTDEELLRDPRWSDPWDAPR
ncbi:MAG: di-heme enzyme [Bryobacterales bacterium]|nr:di-heme enzyme [Bryobacterales bacterium]